jgi:hypothetical protein
MGRSYVTNAELTYNSPHNSRTAQIGLAITDVRRRALPANRHRWRGLAFLMRPISGPVRGQLNEDGGLTSGVGHVADWCGRVRPNAQAAHTVQFCAHLSQL